MKKFGLSGNALKILAALFMLIDHIGYMLFPGVRILRILGRLAFPIFAYMIAEGCRYTRNRRNYFLQLFVLGAACQIVNYIALRDTLMCILITFSISILLIYLLQFVKRVTFDPAKPWYGKCSAVLLFLTAVAGTYLLNCYVKIDYGFLGCVTPVAASLFMERDRNAAPNWLLKLDRHWIHVLLLGLVLLILAATRSKVQFYALLALPVLLCYSGKRGKWRMKYFFYLFYPAHLVALYGIGLLMG